MDPAVDSQARVVVIPVGISRYREPSPAQAARGRRRFDDLHGVEADLESLRGLFDSAPYRARGFQMLPVTTGSAGEIIEKLNAIADAVAAEPGRTVLLFWSGHGDLPEGGELRLATTESAYPMTVADGLPPGELVNKLAASGAHCFGLVIDVCYAGAAAGAVASAAAQRFRENPQAGFTGMAALFCAQPHQPAVDRTFGHVLERVLREGPSAPARMRIAARGWGGFTRSSLLTMREVDDVVTVEFEVLQERDPLAQVPVGQSLGRDFGLFPNPLYRPDAAPIGVEVARRQWMRPQDFETHFLPKARGLEPGEEGWYFSGRAAVSRDIVDWLHARGPIAHERLFVLTGSGGTGKSAILGRLVALSDPAFRASATAGAPRHDPVGTVPEGAAVDAALHLRNLDALGAAGALSDLLGIAAPKAESGGLEAWLLTAQHHFADDQRLCAIVLDALDEAAAPSAIVDRVIRPLRDAGWRFLIGSRPSAAARGARQLLDRLGSAYCRDLDREPDTEADIAEYVRQRLLHATGSPYAGRTEQVAAMAARIAARADRRFLFARLAVSALLRKPAIEPEAMDRAIGGSIGELLGRELSATDAEFMAAFERADAGATTLLAALAYAEGDGLPLRDSVWCIVAGALDPRALRFDHEHVQWILREAGRYVVESGDGEQAVYRLFHESLNEHFRAAFDAAAVRERVGGALRRDVEDHGGWAFANAHVVRHLPAYFREAQRATVDLCTDPSYLYRAIDVLGADRLAELLEAAFRRHRITAIEAVAKSVRRARVALSRDPHQLAAQLHARLSGERHGALKALIHALPQAAPGPWLRSRAPALDWHAALETMQTFGAKIRALAFGTIDGEGIVAVGAGTQVHLWNPRMGALSGSVIDNGGLRVTALAFGAIDGCEVLAIAAGYDDRLIVRDVRTGAQVGSAVPCDYGPIAVGREGDRDVVYVPHGTEFVGRALGSTERIDDEPFFAEGLGQIGAQPVAFARDLTAWRVYSLVTGDRIGKSIELPPGCSMTAVGEWRGRAIACVSTASLMQVIDLAIGEPIFLLKEVEFHVRSIVAGEVDGELIVALSNDSDVESGYVAIRQPRTLAEDVEPAAGELGEARVLGVGFDRSVAGRKAPLVLLVEGNVAVDPLRRNPARVGTRMSDVDLVSGAWLVPAALVESAERIPGGHGAGRGFIVRRDRPLQWPIACEAWATIGGRLLHARGSTCGVAWVVDMTTHLVIAGPFRDIPQEQRVWTNVKKVVDDQRPADAIALGEWGGRAVVAIAHRGRVDVFEMASGALIGSPRSGQSEIVTVALGEADGRPLLATGSRYGAVTVWEGPSMRRVAGITLDAGVRDVWLARDVVAVRTTGHRLHVFDLVTARRTSKRKR